METNGREKNVEAGIIEQEGESSLQKVSSTNNDSKKEKNEAADEEGLVEKVFEKEEVPSWKNQLTVRAFVVSFVMSVMFSFIVMKLGLTTGIIPSLNVPAALLGFLFVRTWTQILDKSGVLRQRFTRQENTVIQTCVVASSGVAFSGGFGTYLLAMSERVVAQSEGGKTRISYKNPQFGWMIGFLLVVCFRGLFAVVPLSKILIIDFRLKYPSGTVTAHLINIFHTPKGARLVKQQVRTMAKFFSFSFLWGVFQWFFTAGNNCGFESFPTFGLKAYQNKFFFDFSTTMVGVGMICPHIINVSILVGGILSWGIMWPLIKNKEGDWFPAGLSDRSLQGLQGYKLFIGLSMMLGDGLYNSFKVLSTTGAGLLMKILGRNTKMYPSLSDSSSGKPPSFDDQRRSQIFLKDQIPTRIAVGGYVIITAISYKILPHIFPQLKWYHIIVIYICAPMLALCNAFGCGLTDWSLASNYGKLALFTIGAWAGASNDGVLAGLAAGGIIINMVSTASDLMQDLKTGYMTFASPRSMFVSQLIGTAFGCVISPCVFWIFYKALPDLGKHGSANPAPYATLYYEIAKLGVEGFSALPKNCLKLSYGFFCAAILIHIIKDAVGKKHGKFIPLPTAMAIPFYLGPFVAIDMCVGSLILYIWQKMNKAEADAFAPAVASGLICGDGIWTLPSSILAVIGVKPPICMKFLSRSTNRKVDMFLGT